MSKRMSWAIAAVFVLLAGIIVYSTMSLNRFECEVCMEFNGHTVCRTAAGASREEAIRTATDNACSQLANGMTQNIACGNTRPKSIRWINP